MNKELHDSIFEALEDRKDWERKQVQFYNLRYGRGTAPKAYPGSPNLKFKLADTLIDGIKPYYIQQLYSDEILCSFLSLNDQTPELTTSVAYWFDYHLKHCSNFEREIYSGVDGELEGGAMPFKVFWNTDKKMLAFDAIDPLHFIVPNWTKELCNSDWLVHVLHYSKEQYKADSRFNQDEDFIKRITGKGDQSGQRDKEQTINWREGINCGEDDQIVLWECYYQKGKDWLVDVVSPVLPYDSDEKVKGPMGLAFKHGEPPFCLLRYEVTRKGHYAPRGITEITASHESYLNRTWNSKAVWMQFNVNPNYESDVPIPNAVNFQNAPGKILPAGLRKQAPAPPPAELDQEMAFTRALAERRVQLPDLANGQHMTPGRGGQGDRVTATQINAIIGQSGQGNDLRARIFRLDLGDIFKMAYSVLLQYASSSLVYVNREAIAKLDPAALHDKYIITPNGSPDSWNKASRLAKAISMVQLWQGGPMGQYIRWSEATKWLLEQDDPRLIKRLVADPQDLAQDQSEIQENEIVRILANFACRIHQSDDDKVHLGILGHFYNVRVQQQDPVTPIQAQAFLQHTQSHLQALSQKKDKALPEIAKVLEPFMMILQQLASQQPQNVVPMQSPAAGAPSGQPAVPSGAAAASEPAPGQDPDKRAELAIKAGTMLTGMIKAGVDVSHLDINTIFRELGLPDLPTNPISNKPPPPVAAKGASS